ncbi:DUF3221 domain-containing protein [Sporosarcina soli]|uniref:DUF3221 domain-containing protein n=1 Tax=Sporosarcina soli TaxID=334736 RepID=A0ABW0TFD7_9BACL
MKKYFLLLLIGCSALVACHMEEVAVKGQYDLKGIITKIDSEGERLLVKDANEGLTWISLPENKVSATFNIGQEIVVWIDGEIAESAPAFAKAANIELAKQALHPFDFKNTDFPPTPLGLVTIHETTYEMTRGGFTWTKGNQTVQTDAASPTQIAESIEAIVTEPNSKVSIGIAQDPHLSVYLWEVERNDFISEGNELIIPHSSGRYVYEVIAKWSNGEQSYTFVVEVK